ncbi:single-stranded DNA-binding protein [Paratractidigestivibacter sp.]|uniref:single-stranded DNA-binding protein n=1 Tax=Paratractidigestivibacter sp. TaxID=2847316 RepID=UPI002AC9ED44|nr:single-stranded DNA-binding protein [Paratractidigestivibacter sp.]
MSINRVNISGNLTRDPELRATAGGMQVLGFGVAISDRRKNAQTGQWEDYPNFVDCTMFGNRAESMGRILHKGMKVAIEGKLRYSSWKKDGQRRSKLEVIVDEIELMSQNPNGQQAQQYAPQGHQPQAYAPQQQAYQPQPAPQQQAAPQWNAQQAYQNPPAVPQPRQQAPAPQAYAPQQAPAPQAYAPQQAPQAAPQQPAPVQQSMDVYDEDIPFLGRAACKSWTR